MKRLLSDKGGENMVYLFNEWCRRNGIIYDVVFIVEKEC